MSRSRRRPAIGNCWCGARGAQLVAGESPAGNLAFHGFPACVNHLVPGRWPAWVWRGIAETLLWENSPAWEDDACPLCAVPHSPETTCAAFRAELAAAGDYRPPAVH